MDLAKIRGIEFDILTALKSRGECSTSGKAEGKINPEMGGEFKGTNIMSYFW